MAIIFLYVGCFLMFFGAAAAYVTLRNINEIVTELDRLVKHKLSNIIVKILVLTIIPTLCVTSIIMGISFTMAMSRL